MRITVFAEGSDGPANKPRHTAFTDLWQKTLVEALGLRPIDCVVSISKQNIEAMEPGRPMVSGCGAPFDEIMRLQLSRQPFDVAIVAWDLKPDWHDVEPKGCRWSETLRFYELLAAANSVLPDPWKKKAARRAAELAARGTPSVRLSPPQLRMFDIWALCMEPEFEGFLVASESGVKRALGAAGRKVPGWPRQWKQRAAAKPKDQVLQVALGAVRKIRPKPEPVRQIQGDMETHAHEWGGYLVRELAADKSARKAMLAHNTAARLVELLGP